MQPTDGRQKLRTNADALGKKEVKASLPKTPKVEGKTPKAISSEEKSIMESAPQPIKGVEVPDDYVPKD